jgi:hypothetical protein
MQGAADSKTAIPGIGPAFGRLTPYLSYNNAGNFLAFRQL